MKRNAARSEKAAGSRPHGRAIRARRCSVVASRYHWRNYQTLFRAKGTETTRYTAPAVPQRGADEKMSRSMTTAKCDAAAHTVHTWAVYYILYQLMDQRCPFFDDTRSSRRLSNCG